MEEQANASPEQLDEWVNFLVAPVAGAAWTAWENRDAIKQAWKDKTVTPETRNELMKDFAVNTALSAGIGLGAKAAVKIGAWAAAGVHPIKSVRNAIGNIARRGKRGWNKIRGPARQAKIEKDIAKINKKTRPDIYKEGKIVAELRSEQLNEWIGPAIAAGAALGGGKWFIDQFEKLEEESEELNEFLPAALAVAGVAAAGAAGWNWIKGTKKKVKDRKDTHQDKIDQALNDSVEPQPWWNDMDTTLQEMKAEIMGTSKKK